MCFGVCEGMEAAQAAASARSPAQAIGVDSKVASFLEPFGSRMILAQAAATAASSPREPGVL